MDGIIIINKTKGCTSHDIVYKIKKMLNEKVGHTGTLDPMAEGVLPILIGKGTLLSKYLINHDKKYIVGIAKNKIKRFYRFKYKIKNMFLYNEEISTIDNVSSDYNLEESIFMKYDVDLVWKLISKKPAVVSKVIYLYYYEGYTIKEISSILNISESNVKHYIYRTINELNIRGV